VPRATAPKVELSSSTEQLAEVAAAPAEPLPPANVYTALAAVQANIPEVLKGRTAEVAGVSKSGTPFRYSYTYADLASVTEAILPLLGARGLAWVTMPTMTSAGMALKYELVHGASNTRIEGVLPIAGSDPQALAGQITYYRRYALCAVTGVAADEDDDGARASAHVREERQQQQRPPQRQEEPRQERPRSQPAGQSRPADTPPAAPMTPERLDHLAISLVEGPLPALVENWRGAHGLGVLNAKPSMDAIERFRRPYVEENDPDVTDFLPTSATTLRELVVWRLSEEARMSTCKPDIRQLYAIAAELDNLNLGPARLTDTYSLAEYLKDRAGELPEERPAPDPWITNGQTFEQWAADHPEDPRAHAAATWKPDPAPIDPPWDTEPPMTDEQRAKVSEVAEELRQDAHADMDAAEGATHG
jgi:hypothetical protein